MPRGWGARMKFPLEELKIIDQTVRMFTEPQLRGDIDMLADLWETENNAKASRIAALTESKRRIYSQPKSLLYYCAQEGIEPEEKEGKKWADPSVCKRLSDSFMRELLEHPSERIRLR